MFGVIEAETGKLLFICQSEEKAFEAVKDGEIVVILDDEGFLEVKPVNPVLK